MSDPDGLLAAEEVIAIQDALGAMAGIKGAQQCDSTEGLKVTQRVMLLAAKALTAFDGRAGFGALHVLDGRAMWALGKLIYTIGDIRMRGREDQLHLLVAEYRILALGYRPSRPHWQDFFDGSLRHDVCYHLLKLWQLDIVHWNVNDGRIHTAREKPRDRLTGVQQRLLGFADALAGNYAERPTIADLRRMPPLFQLGLGALLMATGMYRVTDNREHVDRWIRWVKGECIERDRMVTMTPGVHQALKRRIPAPRKAS